MAERVCVAQIGAAHGMRGEVKLWSFTADPMAVAGLRPARKRGRHAALRDRGAAAGQGPSGGAAARRARPRRGRGAAQRRALRAARAAAADRGERRVLPRRPDRACGRRRATARRSARSWRSTISAPAICSRSRPDDERDDRDAAVHRRRPCRWSTSPAAASSSIRRKGCSRAGPSVGRRATSIGQRHGHPFLLAIRHAPRVLQLRAVRHRSRRQALADHRALLSGAEIHRSRAAEEDPQGREADHRQEPCRQAHAPRSGPTGTR